MQQLPGTLLLLLGEDGVDDGVCKEHSGENVGECVLTINDSNNTKCCPNNGGNVEDDGQYCKGGNSCVVHFPSLSVSEHNLTQALIMVQHSN